MNDNEFESLVLKTYEDYDNAINLMKLELDKVLDGRPLVSIIKGKDGVVRFFVEEEKKPIYIFKIGQGKLEDLLKLEC